MNLQIIITYLAMPYGLIWQAHASEWDLGDPIDYGKTIQEAIDNLLESYEMKNIEVTKYTWK